MLTRIRDFSRNPQDLVSRDDLAAFLQADLGLDLDTSERMILWLQQQQYLTETSMSYYDGARGEVVARRHYRHGPHFRSPKAVPEQVPITAPSDQVQHQR